MKKHNSPIVQVFARPLGRPWIVVSDFREAQDIMTRRTGEFDRSQFFGDAFGLIFPHNQVQMPTGDEWRAHRKLMADTMSDSFLNTVAGPQIYSSALVTVELWKEKTRLAKGRSFDAMQDVYKGALDAIWAATFGTELGTIRSQLRLLASIDDIPVPDNMDDAAILPVAEDPAAFRALIDLTDSIEIAMQSPVPRIHHYLVLKLTPSLVAASKTKDKLIRQHLDQAWEKMQHHANESAVKSALELVVQREVAMAKKEQRSARYDTPAIRDELFGYLIAGHDTTSTTICWGLKFLTMHQAIQQKLRSALHAALEDAYAAGRQPFAEEIVRASIPYLDAVIEEVQRCGTTAAVIIRRTLVDAVVLGHVVPKGTDVFMLNNGPGYIDKSIAVDEKNRSRSSQDPKGKNGYWDACDIGVFMPERWLGRNEKDEIVFDSRAGPSHPFGAGPRGCFGRKLASLELRIILVLIFWNFELQPTPEHLSTFAARDSPTHTPQQVCLRLAALS